MNKKKQVMPHFQNVWVLSLVNAGVTPAGSMVDLVQELIVARYIDQGGFRAHVLLSR